MKEKGSTKENYLFTAMRLFAERGYDAVGVAEIAREVGCSASTLYKHYKNKQELFEAIIERSKREFEQNMARLKVNFSATAEERAALLALTEDDHVILMKRLFEAIAFGEEPRVFRRLVEKERSAHPELALLYSEHYLRQQFCSFEQLMRIWIEGGICKGCDPYLLAVEYVSPVIAMIALCDNDPSKRDEALSLIERHVRQFYHLHRGEKENICNRQ
ncbi:MAG: TetR/AcrR family transcriptional regulator [Christensenellaceae bacterium]